eukprot:403336484
MIFANRRTPKTTIIIKGQHKSKNVLNPIFYIAEYESQPKFLKLSLQYEVSERSKASWTSSYEKRKSNLKEPTTSKKKQYKLAGTFKSSKGK